MIRWWKVRLYTHNFPKSENHWSKLRAYICVGVSVKAQHSLCIHESLALSLSVFLSFSRCVPLSLYCMSTCVHVKWCEREILSLYTSQWDQNLRTVFLLSLWKIFSICFSFAIQVTQNSMTLHKLNETKKRIRKTKVKWWWFFNKNLCKRTLHSISFYI